LLYLYRSEFHAHVMQMESVRRRYGDFRWPVSVTWGRAISVASTGGKPWSAAVTTDTANGLGPGHAQVDPLREIYF
jgi:hypothetical protein